MTTRADTMAPAARSRPVGGARVEHISLEAADPEQVPAALTRPPRRKVRSTYVLKSWVRGCETEVSILEDHYASVRYVRPREQVRKYDLDLRFASPKPVRVRCVSWFWLALAVGLSMLAGGALWAIEPQAQAALWRQPVFVAAVVTLLAACGALLMFMRRTVESLEFTSVHGGATLIRVAGGIGSARAGKRFFVELIKNINAAKLARPQPKQQFLRDEMREHHRLRDLGVLSDEQYEQSKSRILGAH